MGWHRNGLGMGLCQEPHYMRMCCHVLGSQGSGDAGLSGLGEREVHPYVLTVHAAGH